MAYSVRVCRGRVLRLTLDEASLLSAEYGRFGVGVGLIGHAARTTPIMLPKRAKLLISIYVVQHSWDGRPALGWRAGGQGAQGRAGTVVSRKCGALIPEQGEFGSVAALSDRRATARHAVGHNSQLL
jgi:hypothetical protein